MQPSAQSLSDKQEFSLLTTQQPLIPNITLDPFSTAAIFSLYNVLYAKDRIGTCKHIVYHQPSITLCTLPIIGDVNYQTLQRNYQGNSRNEVSDFVISIIEAISAYLKYDAFKKMLPDLKKGVIRYMNSYGRVTDNATTSFQLAIDRIQEAIEWNGEGEFQTKQVEKLPKELTQNQKKYYAYWSEPEITHVANGIFLAIQKKDKNENCEAEVESTKKYLEIKQQEISQLLESKLKTLHNTK